MSKISLNIGGMDCASCAQNISRVLKRQAGVISAEVNFAMNKAYVEYDETKIDQEKIKTIIKKTGYQVLEAGKPLLTPPDKEEKLTAASSSAEKKINWQRNKMLLALAFTLPLLARMLWPWEISGRFLNLAATDWAQIILAFFVVFVFGAQFHKSAGRQIVRGQLNMDSLISLGTLTAFFYSLWAVWAGQEMYFESAASIASLILLGKYLEEKTKNKASSAMRKLMELGAKKAFIIDSTGKISEKEIETVQEGEIALIRPGEKIPLDGIIIEGAADIDEAMLTGEGLPASKQKNDNVFGGTINKNGQLKIKITQTGENTILAKIIKTVEEAQNFKAPLQKLADKISGIFIPAVMAISLLTFFGWYFLEHNYSAGIINAVTVLIIACPCALGLATPIAVMVGTSVGAKKGILIKNGESFEKAKKIDTAVFDKTGTLTKGEPKAVEIILRENYQREKILEIAAALAPNSHHPLSQAIAKMTKQEKNSSAEIKNFFEYPGRGLSGVFNGEKYLLGNKKLLLENNLDASWAEKIDLEKSSEGGTLIFLAREREIIAAFLLRDEIKTASEETIYTLKKMGIKSILLSGDREASVSFTAAMIGIDEYFSEILPNEKQNKVKALQALGQKIVFVGDGINDAPSLVQADLGIAMGGGSDIAKEAGDIIIMGNEPLKVIEALKLSKKTFSIIKQNLFWAFFYNILAIPLAILGIANPVVGALAMAFSDITVIGNTLRIYKK